jgi:VIT1/CCC1 family predicted Fe2+/Mn2+ transporter
MSSSMARSLSHNERHLVARIGWMRAAVLGANDGIVSTASLVVGVAAAGAARGDIVVAGVAGLVAGAMSMAAGEYVSVSSQSDTEKADLAREAGELKTSPEFEQNELADLYVARGLEPDLARQVAVQLMAKDALGAHARDELGISGATTARPIQAAFTSAATFAIGAFLPLVIVFLAPAHALIPAIATSSLFFLGVLGAVGARTGGAAMLKPVVRVVFWGAVALVITAGIGAVFGNIA